MTSQSIATIDEVRTTVRSQMPVAERWAYFDHAAVAPLPRPAGDAISRWLSQAMNEGDTVWPEWAQAVEGVRQTAAGLINAHPREIALVPNTTAGINFVAEGIDWRPGDNVVTLADEFPSNLYPWMHQRDRGVEVRMISTDHGRLDLNELREACDARTRLVSMSWVGYMTGYRHDVDAAVEIAHNAGAWFFLDAIQGMGVFPLDVRRTPVDFLAADGHKWMLGPEGAGFAYVRAERLDQLRAIGVGWNSVARREEFTRIEYKLRPEAARYEGGSMNMVGMLGFGASLGLLASLPAEVVAGAALEVTDLACERLASAGASVVSHRAPGHGGHDPRSGIVAFELPGRDPQEARRRCLEEGVVLSCRGGRLRLAAHCYNNAEDVERLISSLFA